MELAIELRSHTFKPLCVVREVYSDKAMLKIN